MEPTAAITVNALQKTYARSKLAVDIAALRVEEGQIAVLLGPNGAGKSTLLRMLTSLSRPNAGDFTIGPHDGIKNPGGVRHAIGYVPQTSVHDAQDSPAAILDMFGRLNQMSRTARRARAERLFSNFGLSEWRDAHVGTLSGGMRRRVDIMAAMMHEPRILIMDEPSAGLDLAGRDELWRFIRSAVKENQMTVLYTTHDLMEADQHSDHVTIMDAGRIVAEGTTAALKAKLKGEIVVVEFAAVPNADRAAEFLRSVAGVVSVQFVADAAHLAVLDARRDLWPVLDALRHFVADIKGVEVRRPTLCDVYVAVTGKVFVVETVAVPPKRGYGA
ncbi:MAG: ABC transporter ATP-binding protein [Alphaproteobacteria bacterium]|nr:ABC transporter ATP-binding protein [Alphaproteobacteria bacterium]MDE2012299.1 ABC transporter ATP-binding protein [Alphaproteobacteria bacterium]